MIVGRLDALATGEGPERDFDVQHVVSKGVRLGVVGRRKLGPRHLATTRTPAAMGLMLRHVHQPWRQLDDLMPTRLGHVRARRTRQGVPTAFTVRRIIMLNRLRQSLDWQSLSQMRRMARLSLFQLGLSAWHDLLTNTPFHWPTMIYLCPS